MPPAARGNPEALSLGPGYLYVSHLGAAEPDDLTTDWETVDPEWVLLGYTETGSEFNYALSTGDVQVAEELDPVMITTTGRTSSVVFNMAELTASHLSLAMNGGTIGYGTGGPASSPVVIVEPPPLGQEMRYMFGHESEDHTERWIFRKCFQTGTLKISRTKGNTPATVAATFSLEKPTNGAPLFAAIMSRAIRGGFWVPPIAGAPLVPTLTAAMPNQHTAGAGTLTGVQLAGTNLTGATAVEFGTDPATNVVVNSATQITCDAPDNATAGPVNVTVTTPGGTSAPLVFTYI